MKAPGELRHSRLWGLGEFRPTRLVTNDALSASLDTSDEWIQRRTGIKTRAIAGDADSVVAMATEAARKAVAASGVDPRQIGLVVLATCSLPHAVPGGAAQIATALDAISAGAMDVNAACAGFCYALGMASDAVRGHTVDYAVVIGAERLSDVVDWQDRSSAILFGDGAGAVVVGPSAEAGISRTVFGSDGTGAGLIDMTADHKLRLDGPAVFRWATTALAPIAAQVCAAAGVEPAALDAIVLHQANLRIITPIADRLGAPNAVVAQDVVDAGNTSAASVPLALARLRREGRVSGGALALTLAFGAGLTWAGAVVTVP